MDGEIIESDEAPGLEQGNWSFMPRFDSELGAGALDRQQVDFAHLLAEAVEHTDWDDGASVQASYKQALVETGIPARQGANAIYDLLLESRFSVPPGWLMSSMERDSVLRLLQRA